jgi:toxin ParE1/3/4
MSWQVIARPEVEGDIAEAADWYDFRLQGLGAEFREAVIRVFDSLVDNPLLNSRHHPRKDIRWRYPERFPYRVVYEVDEEQKIVVIAAVLHAARHDRHWKQRF